MPTRTLIAIALVTGLVILVAFAVQVLMAR
jgi:hypothetical protein